MSAQMCTHTSLHTLPLPVTSTDDVDDFKVTAEVDEAPCKVVRARDDEDTMAAVGGRP